MSSPLAAFAQSTAIRSVGIVPDGTRRSVGFDPADSAGLFIGIRQFQDPQLASVPFAVDDAVDLAHLFVFDLELLHGDRVILALEGKPQKAASQRRLKELLDAGAEAHRALRSDFFRLLNRQAGVSGPSGLFVATIATHGFSKEGRDSLVTWDAVRSDLSKTGFAVSDLLEKIAEAGAPRRLVLIDACRERLVRSRSLGRQNTGLGRSFAEAIEEAKGQVVLAAATENGFAYDDMERQNGVFTAAVIDGLRGAAQSDDRGFITVETVAAFAQERVLWWVEQYRKEDLGRSRGITRTLEGPAATLPLAVARRPISLDERKQLAIARLEAEVGSEITPEMVLDLKKLMEESSAETTTSWLEQIEELDGSPMPRRSLAWSYAQLKPQTQTPDSIRQAREQPSQIVNRPENRGTSENVDREIRSPEPSSSSFAASVEDKRKPDTENLWQDPFSGMRFRYVSEETEASSAPGFWIGETEVTQEQWERIMEENAARFKDCGRKCPIESVTWYEAITFANKISEMSTLQPCYRLSQKQGALGAELRYGLVEQVESCTGYRLPTQAEWELAATAGKDESRKELDKVAWYAENSTVSYRAGSDCPLSAADRGSASASCGTHPVGELMPNRWGLRDMLGNVSEWCWDPDLSYTGPKLESRWGVDPGPARVVCGSSWSSHKDFIHEAYQSSRVAGWADEKIGLRLVRNPTKQETSGILEKKYKKPRIRAH